MNATPTTEPAALGTDALREEKRTRAETSPNELAAILAGNVAPDARRVTVGRVYTVDLPRAVRRWAKKYSRADRETLRTDALLWIAEREALKVAEWRRDHAPSRALAVAGYIHEVQRATRGGHVAAMPLRRDWIAADGQLTGHALRTLHTALNVAKHRADTRREDARAMAELPTDGRALAEIAESERRDAEPETLTVPEHGASLIAAAMGLPETAARALIYDGHELTPDDAAELWGIPRASVAPRVSEGRRILADRYPEPRELIDAVRDAAGGMREALADAAALTLSEYRDGYATETAARTAAGEWRSEVAAMSPERRALTVAARRAGCGAEYSERVALSVSRILRAETARGRKLADRGARGGQCMPGHAETASADRWDGAPLTRTAALSAEPIDCSGQSYPAGLYPSSGRLAPDSAGFTSYSARHAARAELAERERLADLDH